MATAPRINLFDSTGTTTNLVVTTNLRGIQFSGTVDPNTVDVQININDAGFVSDPTLVGLVLPNFRVPNPLSFPEGIALETGYNTIQIRSVDISGSVSTPSTVTVNAVPSVESQLAFAPPSGLNVRRRATTLDIVWSNLNSESAVGYNVYGSPAAGGGTNGYLKINLDIIPSSKATETVTDETVMLDFTYNFTEPDENLELQVQLQTADSITGEISELKGTTSWPLFASPDFSFHGEIIRRTELKQFVFNHNRNSTANAGILNTDTFSAVQPDDPIFYVVTAVYTDPTTSQLMESRFSPEVSGGPLPLDTQIRGIKIRDQRQVAADYINEISKTEPTLSLIPGSTVREVHIEPFSNEIQKAYFLLDFVHRAKSFPALLAIDDPGMTGTSVLVANSAYKSNLKTALNVSDDTSVQSLIDGAFDSLAQNYGRKRKGQKFASVLQTFYTMTKPTRNLVVSQNAVVASNQNSTAPRFRSFGQVTLFAANAQAYYNNDSKRYEIQVQMIAESPGSIGNVPAGDLNTVTSGASGLSTINDVASNFGSDRQNNLDLSEDCLNALSSLDTGTSGGYERIANGTPGVFQALVVKSGDEFMMRDWDPVRLRHTGGKVDLYIKGLLERTVSETFAFQFNIAQSVRFEIVDSSELIFRARDSRLSPQSSIQEMLYNPSQNFGLRNHSNFPTSSYDLTGVMIIDYRTIKVSTLIPQPETRFDDFIEGDYRYQSSNRFISKIQPVRRVVSVVGESSGELDPSSGFSLYKNQDQLVEGESTISQDYVSIEQVDGIPSGILIPVNDEQHVMIGEFVESLGKVGVNVLTIKVLSKDRSLVYNGPNTVNPDYFIISGTQTVPAKIIRSADSAINTGSVVSVDYEHDENFVITYVVNDVLQQLQANINKSKHTTADAIAKQATENPLSIEATVQLKPNSVQATVDSNIRTAITVMTDGKGVGQSIYQTDITAAMKSVTGVDYIIQPFFKMTLKDGAVRIREPIPSDYTFVPSLSLFANAVYVLDQPLPFNTVDSGVDKNVFNGVFKDNLVMIQSESIDTVGYYPNQAWVIGAKGSVIQGYSDDATLLADGVDQEDITSKRLSLTANKVFLSLDNSQSPPDVPSMHSFSVTYVVHGDMGSKDINVSSIEYVTPGDLTFTYKLA